MYDANLNSLGAFQTFSLDADGNCYSTPGSSTSHNYIQSGQAFFVASDVVKAVPYTNSGERLKVFPNPVVDGKINLQFINHPMGKYLVRLIDNLGQPIMEKQIEHNENRITETIQLDNTTAKGSYHLEVTSPGKSNISIKIIIQ